MSDSSPTREEAVQMGRKGGKRSNQQDVRVDADTMVGQDVEMGT